MIEAKLTNAALFDEERLVGVTARIGPAHTDVVLADARQQMVNIGGFVLIECGGELAVVGQVMEVTSDQYQQGVYARVQMVASVQLDNYAIFPGVARYPKTNSRVFVAHPRLVQLVAQPHQPGATGKLKGAPVLLSFASLATAEDVPLSFTPEMMFGCHCAVVGTTGSGKSWSLARMIEECAAHNAKVIVFDATGEFHSLTKGIRHVYLGEDLEPLGGSIEVVMPYYHLTVSDLFAIFEPSGESQAPKLQAAIRSLKLAKLVPELAPDGTIMKANKSKTRFEDEYQRNIQVVENPMVDIDIRHLTRQIDNECCKANRSALETNYWGDVHAPDQAMCTPLVTRIIECLQSPTLGPIFRPSEKPSLFKVIDLFLKDKETKVLRVSLQYLSFAHHAREIIANAAGRYLLELARKNRYRKKPLLVVLDEAHQFLNKSLGDEARRFPLDSFEIIAKEGRKYGLSICIATQRPRDIPEGVLSQMGTLVIHRLINDRDRSVVERAASSIDKGSIETLPTLSPGEAVLVGRDFPVPMLVRIDAPEAKPDSRGPDYQRFWRES